MCLFSVIYRLDPFGYRSAIGISDSCHRPLSFIDRTDTVITHAFPRFLSLVERTLLWFVRSKAFGGVNHVSAPSLWLIERILFGFDRAAADKDMTDASVSVFLILFYIRLVTD